MEDRVAEARRLILSKAPHVLDTAHSKNMEGVDLAELEQDLVGHTCLEPEDGRVAAALGYYTNPSEALCLFATAHAPQLLEEELQRQHSFAWTDPQGEVNRLLNGTSIFDLAQMIGPDCAWLVATCSLLSSAQSCVIFEKIGSPLDSANLALAYAMVTFVPEHIRRDLMERLMRGGDALRNAAGVALAYEWMCGDIIADRIPDIEIVNIILRSDRPLRTEALGRLSQRFVYWIESRRLSTARQQLAIDALLAMIDAVKVSDDLRPRDIEAILKAAETRAACVLAAMSRWLIGSVSVSPPLVSAVQRGGLMTLRRLFGSVMACTDDERQSQFLLLQPLLGPLKAAFAGIGIDPATFTELYQGLSTDRYSRDHRRSFWSSDRIRAVALIAIGAAVARDRQDSGLMQAARDAAAHVRSQPASDMVNWALDFSGMLDDIDFYIPSR